MLPDISEIKRRRMKLGLKQKDLAIASGVSQSLIAKIESGKLNPSYGIAKRIFLALDGYERKEEIKAKDIMTKHIYFAEKNDTIKNVVKTMRKHGISQLPVISKKRILGSLTEKAIMECIGKTDGGVRLADIKVALVMEESFPTVDENAPLSVIKSLLSYSQAVLVMKSNRAIGIITKSDLFKLTR